MFLNDVFKCVEIKNTFGVVNTYPSLAFRKVFIFIIFYFYLSDFYILPVLKAKGELRSKKWVLENNYETTIQRL